MYFDRIFLYRIRGESLDCWVIIEFSLLGRDGLARTGDMSALTLPSERYPRRASDGCASIGQFRTMGERDGEDAVATVSGAVSSASKLKAIQQEYQALQVSDFLDQLFVYCTFFYSCFTFDHTASNGWK